MEGFKYSGPSVYNGEPPGILNSDCLNPVLYSKDDEVWILRRGSQVRGYWSHGIYSFSVLPLSLSLSGLAPMLLQWPVK